MSLNESFYNLFDFSVSPFHFDGVLNLVISFGDSGTSNPSIYLFRHCYFGYSTPEDRFHVWNYLKYQSKLTLPSQ